MSKNKFKYIITNACITCQTCEINCPVKAISFNEDEFKYSIDESKCIKCGLCYRNCVYRAIKREEII